MEAITSAVLNLVLSLAAGAIGYVAVKAKNYFATVTASVETETKEQVAAIAVNAVEQLAKAGNIESKYEEAKKRALEMLSEKGVTITDEELNTMIESCVNVIRTQVEEG